MLKLKNWARILALVMIIITPTLLVLLTSFSMPIFSEVITDENGLSRVADPTLESCIKGTIYLTKMSLLLLIPFIIPIFYLTRPSAKAQFK